VKLTAGKNRVDGSSETAEHVEADGGSRRMLRCCGFLGAWRTRRRERGGSRGARGGSTPFKCGQGVGRRAHDARSGRRLWLGLAWRLREEGDDADARARLVSGCGEGRARDNGCRPSGPAQEKKRGRASGPRE